MTKVIQRTPNLGLKIRLQPVTNATPATPAVGGPVQVVWSMAESFGYDPITQAHRGSVPGAGEFARLHEWRPGAAPITPIALMNDWADMWLVATCHGAPAGATIEWQITTDYPRPDDGVQFQTDYALYNPDAYEEPRPVVASGVSCTLILRYLWLDSWEGDGPWSATLTALINGAPAGSVTVYWKAYAYAPA